MPDDETPPQFPLTFPDTVADFVRGVYAEAGGVLEYGSGGSTLLAAEAGVPCVSVESDAAWAEALNSKLLADFGPDVSASVLHVNIGPTKEWGYPADKRGFKRYWTYPMRVWDEPFAQSVDTVLIDGRMRKACFAAVLTSATREVRVLFDDYGNRSGYHAVEAFAKPVRMVERMAEFHISPGMVDISAFRTLLPWFTDLK